MDDHTHLGTSKGPRKIVLGLLTLVYVHLNLLYTKHTSLISRERYFQVKDCLFVKLKVKTEFL